MPLLFYSTEYKPERAQFEINRLLRQMGARRITEEFDSSSQSVVGMSFSLATTRGEQEFLLPVRTERVRKVLERQGVLKGSGQRGSPELQRQHAEAVAWRTLLEWLKVQAALIETDQAAADEVMLPYLLVAGDNGRPAISLYEQYSGQAALPAGSR